MVNQLLTMSIKVNNAPSAESLSGQKGRENEEDKSWPWFLELAHGFGLERSRRQRLRSPFSST
jgi:hypothetical protein